MDIRELVQRAGIAPYQHYIPELDRVGKKVLCKLHGDRNTPNLSLTDKSGKITFHCFACGQHGDVLDFIQAAEGIGKTEAIERLNAITGNESRPGKHKPNQRPSEVLTLETIKALEPEHKYKYIRHHVYKAGEPPYIKALYRRESDGDKTARFFTITGENRYKWNRHCKAVLYNQAALREMPSEFVHYPEGEKDSDALTALGFLSVTAGGANDFGDKTNKHLVEHFKGRDVILFPDNDSPGRACMQRIAALLHGIASSIKIVALPGLPDKGDVSDWILSGGTREELSKIITNAPEWVSEIHEADKAEEEPSQISVISVRDFLSLKLPPRRVLLSPWLPSQGLCMVYGYRGAGKTYILLGIAVALSSGGTFLKWQAQEPQRVLYIDGEMPASTMQERIANVISGSDTEPLDEHLHIITPDLQAHCIPDLATPYGQSIIEPYAEKANVLILDNISTLCRSGAENKGDDWGPVQSWALNLRRKGVSVIFVHHEGKNGYQRGTSKREDVLDTVIKLKRPGDYSPAEGLRVEVHFEKSRGILGEDVRPFETWLVTSDTGSQWETKDLEQSLTERVAALLNEGIPQGEIADLLAVHKGTVSKHKQKAAGLGLLERKA